MLRHLHGIRLHGQGIILFCGVLFFAQEKHNHNGCRRNHKDGCGDEHPHKRREAGGIDVVGNAERIELFHGIADGDGVVAALVARRDILAEQVRIDAHHGAVRIDQRTA